MATQIPARKAVLQLELAKAHSDRAALFRDHNSYRAQADCDRALAAAEDSYVARLHLNCSAASMSLLASKKAAEIGAVDLVISRISSELAEMDSDLLGGFSAPLSDVRLDPESVAGMDECMEFAGAQA